MNHCSYRNRQWTNLSTLASCSWFTKIMPKPWVLPCSAYTQYSVSFCILTVKTALLYQQCFTVTMTALTFRKNSCWLALPFVWLLVGIVMIAIRPFYLFIIFLSSCLVTLRPLDGRNQCVSCRVTVCVMTHCSNCIKQDAARHKMVPWRSRCVFCIKKALCCVNLLMKIQSLLS